MSFWASFWKAEVCGQTVLPDRSILIGQKLKNSNETFLVIFKLCADIHSFDFLNCIEWNAKGLGDNRNEETLLQSLFSGWGFLKKDFRKPSLSALKKKCRGPIMIQLLF